MLEKVFGDCDDTMDLKLMASLDKQIPANWLSGNFYLVPPSKITGVRGKKLGGHAVAVCEVPDGTPRALEQRHRSVKLSWLEDGLGYYCVLFQTMDKDFRKGWSFVDKKGYKLLRSGKISVDEAKQRSAYMKHTNWLHQEWDGISVRPTDGNKATYFKTRALEMFEQRPDIYNKYFTDKEVVMHLDISNTIDWDQFVYFQESEFICNCGCENVQMKEEIVQILDFMREKLGRPIRLNSSYRCPKYNKSIGSKDTSSHPRGYAVDISINTNKDRFELIALAIEFGVSRIGIYKNFIHIDVDPNKTQKVMWVG